MNKNYSVSIETVTPEKANAFLIQTSSASLENVFKIDLEAK